MTYYIYHIPGKKIGVTRDLEERVTKQQGYESDEYEVLTTSEDIGFASDMERQLQKEYGYEVDRVPYNKLKCNNMKMKINVTEQTTTFPCPVNKLKGQLMDNMGLGWSTEFGTCRITIPSIDWIMKNVKESMYNKNRCYVYNKAFSRWFDNNDPYNGKTLAGALSPTGVRQNTIQEAIDCCSDVHCECAVFDDIRMWAEERGLYDKGDPKTQALKLVEEVGETCRAILKRDEPEIVDGIGDCVVVLTNLAHLLDTSIEECTRKAYNEIKNRKGRMDNGTFKKN
jgi:NTP pyrophosphatase (non-canonical NTP hydrolase)